MSTYPTYESLVQTAAEKNGEKILLTVYRSYLSILSQMAAFSASLIVVFVLINVFSDYSDLLRWLAVIPVGLLLNIFRTYFNDVAFFEVDKITKHGGRLGLNYEMPSVKYTDIRALKVSQDLIGRAFDYGDVLIGTGGADGYEMWIHGVRNPYELTKLVEAFRTSSHAVPSKE
jgi:hypothetical protein